MTVDSATGLIEWTPSDTQAGSHGVTVSVSDGRGGEDTQSFVINVAPAEAADNIRPAVEVLVVPDVVNVDESVTITVNASDNVGVASRELTVNGIPVPLDAAGTATYSSGEAGVYTAVGTALDEAGNEGLASKEFRFLFPGDVVPPTVEITLPEADARLSGPNEVLGTAADENLTRYSLEYSPKDRNEFVTFGGGTSSVEDDILGTLDPTMLRNGLYDVRLTAEDASGNIASVTTTYQLEGEMKVGNFTITFNDLTIPVSGIPITITRTYDSRVKLKGDFGVGWKLDIKDLELSESCVMGSDWQQTSTGGMLPWYIISPTRPHYVTVAYPDGRADEFDMQIDPDRQQLIPVTFTTASFAARAGTFSSLIPLDADPVDLWVIGGIGNVELMDWFTLEPFDPDRYQLTTKDGTVYVISQATGVESITDRNGNTITFGPAGIIHSAGKSVLFARDPQGRITTITDPMGNTIEYAYDFYGDLVAVTDQEDNTTEYIYNSNHGLIDIIDPRGVGVARNIYDDDGRLTAIIDADGNRVDFTHNIGTRQEVVTDRLGNVTVYEYDEDGNVVSKSDALGNTTTYTYDPNGNKLSETDALGNTTDYAYDAQDNMTSETDPLGNTTTYTYNSNGQVLTITDPLGNVTTNTYDAGGNLTSTTDPLGNTTTYAYDAAGNLTGSTDTLGNTTGYTYDAVGNMLSQTDPLGNVPTYTYDDNGNRLTETRTRTTASGVETMVTSYVYDGMNRLIQTVDPLGNVAATEYNAIGKESARIDQLGRRTELEYDTRGNLSDTIYPDGTEETFSYDAEGRRINSADRADRVTQYEYDSVGNLIRTTFPDGTSAQSVYDAVGRVSQSIDQRGNTTTYEYDAAGRNTAVTDALGNRTEYTYDENGNRISMTDANGNTTLYEYDALNRLIRTTYSDATSAAVTYDALGRKNTETDQAGNATQFEYDALGRLIRVTDALGGVTTYSYDEVGNRLTQTDANGNTTSFEYDNLGRQIARILPLGMTEAMTYDAAGNVISKTDFNGDTITYGYGPCCNRLIGKDFPDGTWVSFTYTPTGRRETETNNLGETTTYSYDLLDRLLSRTDPDGSVISYTYDDAGNRTSVTTPEGATTYSYDPLNRLLTVSDSDGGLTTYAYDAVGNRTSIAYPNGTAAEYSYDGLNRLINLLNREAGGAVISSYAYTLGPAGNRTRVVEDTGRTVDYAYDGLYRLIQESINDPAAGVTTIDYSYDPVGNRLSRTQAAPAGTTTTTYTYDNNDRLLTETVAVARLPVPDGEVRHAYASLSRPSAAAPYMRDGFMLVSLLALLLPWAIAWAGDAYLGRHARRQRKCIRAICLFMVPLFLLGAENVWAINREASLYTAMTAAGITQGPAMTTYSYDSNGNTLSRSSGVGSDTYTYDYENRLAAGDIQLGPAPGPVSYSYDADGIRTSKTAGATTTSYLVDKNRPFAQVLVETTGATAVSYVHGDDLISMKRPTGTSYYHYDGQMSTRKLTDATETATDSYVYDAFGILLDQTGATVNNYQYTGEQYDPNIGFYYLRARYYNQGVGRFVTVDPFGGSIFDPMSLHKYLYAHASPVMNIDPSGQSVSLVGVMVAVTIIGILASVLYARLFHSLSRASTPVEWSGIIMILTYSPSPVGPAGGGLLIELESECHFGKKGVGKYLVVMAGLTFSASVPGFPSFSVTSITLETPGMFGPNPWVLGGLVTFISASVVVGPVGWSWGGALIMGMGRGEFKWQGNYAFGFTDIGLDVMVGVAAPIYAPRPTSCAW
jgi:RHS repeat-associated protein